MKKYQKYCTMTSLFTCSEVFIETEPGKGIPVKPHNNIVQFDPPVKVLGKSMWACLDESSDNSFAVIFPQFNTISQGGSICFISSTPDGMVNLNFPA